MFIVLNVVSVIVISLQSENERVYTRICVRQHECVNYRTGPARQPHTFLIYDSGRKRRHKNCFPSAPHHLERNGR